PHSFWRNSRPADFLIFRKRRYTIPTMRRLVISSMLVVAGASGPCLGWSQDLPRPSKATNQSPKTSAKHSTARPLTPGEELQKAIGDAGNDRAELVKNLRAYLEKYPDARERPQIYRALVEACIQFKDDACATDYAERIVALTPDDTSMTLLAVQLLEHNGEQAGLH